MAALLFWQNHQKLLLQRLQKWRIFPILMYHRVTLTERHF